MKSRNPVKTKIEIVPEIPFENGKKLGMESGIKKIKNDIEGGFKFNTAIAGLMEFNNALSDYLAQAKNYNKELLLEILEKIALILSPFAPHMAEEMWKDLGKEGLIIDQRWPEVDEKALIEEEKTIVIQISGKVRGKINVKADESEENIKKVALENVAKLIEGKQVLNVIYVPNKLVNIVVK